MKATEVSPSRKQLCLTCKLCGEHRNPAWQSRISDFLHCDPYQERTRAPDSILLGPCSFPQEHAASQNPVRSRSILTWWITYMSSPQDWLELKELWGPARKPRSTFTVWHLHTLRVRSFCEVKYCCVKREMEFSQQNWKGAQPSVCWHLPVPEPCLGVEALWSIGLCMSQGAGCVEWLCLIQTPSIPQPSCLLTKNHTSVLVDFKIFLYFSELPYKWENNPDLDLNFLFNGERALFHVFLHS